MRLIAASTVYRPLAILAAILLIALVVRINILLLHAEIMLLLDER